MKKLVFLCLAIFLVASLAACGGTSANNAADTNNTNNPPTNPEQEVGQQEIEQVGALMEPTEDTKCAYCNMVVYPKEHELGMFSTQAITADGENLFFDDAGCMLNFARMEHVEYDQYVRDYNTLDWLKADEAVLVKADVKTPMNYGYLFFKDEASAQSFIETNSDKHAQLAVWSDLDGIAAERHQMKMEKMKNGESMDMHDLGHEMDQGNMHDTMEHHEQTTDSQAK